MDSNLTYILEDTTAKLSGGISVIVNNTSFSDSGLGKVEFTEEKSNGVNNYGKAIILPDNYDFSDVNLLGSVNFKEDLRVTKLSIWCRSLEVNGRGTMLYPVYYPKQSGHLGVKWSIVSGSDYCELKTFTINPINNTVSENHDIIYSCYVKIKPGVVNKKVIVQCTSTDHTNGYMHNTIELTLNYDNSIETDECGVIEVTTNQGNNLEQVISNKLELYINFYPSNTTHRSWTLTDVNTDYDITCVRDEDTRLRLIRKQNICDDLFSTIKYEYNIYDEGNDLYYDKVTFDIPRCWQTDLIFKADIDYTEINSYIDKEVIQRLKTPYYYTNTLYSELDCEMHDALGYINVSSNSMLIYCELNDAVTNVISNGEITRKYFNNPAIGPKIVTTGIYTPLQFIKDTLGIETKNILVLKYIIKSFTNDLVIKQFNRVDFLVSLYGYVIYNEDTSKFYIVYDNNIYDYDSSFSKININTIIYYDAKLYNVEILEDNKYKLNYIDNSEDKDRMHRASYDISYLVPNHDVMNSDIFNIYKTKKEVFHSTTILNLTDYFGILSENANLIGYDWSAIKIKIDNKFTDESLLDEVTNTTLYNCPITTFGNYIDPENNDNIFEINGSTLLLDPVVQYGIFDDEGNLILDEDGKSYLMEEGKEYNDGIPKQDNGNYVYINYSGVYGEYEDITKYSSKYRLQKAINQGIIECNMNYGKMYNFIIYTESDLMKRYTYYKDYPSSLLDMIAKRNIAEVDLLKNILGLIVNAGYGNKIIFSK